MTPPRTVLVITGSIGGGHHATARAVAEAVGRQWPQARVVTSDVLAGMGTGVGPAFAGIFTWCLRWAGWLYGLHFALLWRVRCYRAGTRAVLGRWSARPLARLLDRECPDLVVATFPEAVAGLGRLRRRGALGVPTVVVPADVAPHPMWCDAALDDHLVSTDAAVALVGRAAPGARASRIAPPVVEAFRPPPPRAPRPRPLAVVACGSLAFGDVARVCARVLDAGLDVEVTAARRPRLRRRLDRLAAAHPGRMVVRDWFDDPAGTMRRGDLVVTTGAGATAHEALACARPLIVVSPIPGHGRAGARLLAAAGLARTCALADLTDTVRRTPPPAAPTGASLSTALATVIARAGDRDGADGRRSRVRGEDALFLHAATRRTRQQLGARVAWHDPEQRTDWPARLRALVAERGGQIDLLTRRLEPPRPGRPLRWRHTVPEPHRHVAGETVAWGPGTALPDVDAATAAVLARPVDPTSVGWTLQVLRGPDPGEVVVVAVVHHALGDGLAVTDALVRLLVDEAPATGASPGAGGRDDGSAPATGAARRWARAAAGIAGLAVTAPAGPSPLTGSSGVAPVRFLGLVWDGAEVRAAARRRGVSTTVLVLAAVADALACGPTTDAAGGHRAMVPVTTRSGATRDAPDNRTAALPVTLPGGPMSVERRVALVDTAYRAAARSHRPAGAAAVLALLGRLPWRVYAALGPVLYGRRFLHLLVSVMPGRRRPLHVAGGRMHRVHPILPLADGVGLAVGALGWGTTLGVGITVDPALVADPERFRARLDRSAVLAP